jgi:predicted nucleotidyltransferase
MKFGLTDHEFESLMTLLVEPLKKLGTQVFIFGSRATGSHQKYSDIDLLYKVLKNRTLPKSEIYKLISNIEESSFPYKIDLVDENDLADSYRSNIEFQMIEI